MGELPLSNGQTSTLQPDSTNPQQKRPRVLDIYLRVIISPAGILLLLGMLVSFIGLRKQVAGSMTRERDQVENSGAHP